MESPLRSFQMFAEPSYWPYLAVGWYSSEKLVLKICGAPIQTTLLWLYDKLIHLLTRTENFYSPHPGTLLTRTSVPLTEGNNTSIISSRSNWSDALEKSYYEADLIREGQAQKHLMPYSQIQEPSRTTRGWQKDEYPRVWEFHPNNLV